MPDTRKIREKSILLQVLRTWIYQTVHHIEYFSNLLTEADKITRNSCSHRRMRSLQKLQAQT